MASREAQEVLKAPLYKELEGLSGGFEQLIYEAPIENAKLMLQDLVVVYKRIKMTLGGLQYYP